MDRDAGSSLVQDSSFSCQVRLHPADKCTTLAIAIAPNTGSNASICFVLSVTDGDVSGEVQVLYGISIPMSDLFYAPTYQDEAKLSTLPLHDDKSMPVTRPLPIFDAPKPKDEAKVSTSPLQDDKSLHHTTKRRSIFKVFPCPNLRLLY